MRMALLVAAVGLGLLTIGPGEIGLPTLEAQPPPQLVINEVAWAGTQAAPTDEWIELHNNTSREIDLTGHALRWDGGDKLIRFSAEASEETNTREVRTLTLSARSFYVLERTDDETISDIAADLIYTGALGNGGTSLELVGPDGDVISTANGDGGEWPAGAASDGDVPYASMERIAPREADDADNWASNDGQVRNGTDADGEPINGTPKADNSRQ